MLLSDELSNTNLATQRCEEEENLKGTAKELASWSIFLCARGRKLIISEPKPESNLRASKRTIRLTSQMKNKLVNDNAAKDDKCYEVYSLQLNK